MNARTPLIMVAPNGARHGKAQHPALPITEEELVETAGTCLEAGAQAIHMHVRDDQGLHVLDVARYNSAVEAVRRATGDRMFIQVTTEAVGRYSPQDIAVILDQVHAPAFSVALREIMPDAAAEKYGADVLAGTIGSGKLVQYLLYHPSELERFISLVEKGVIPDSNLDILFVLGRYGGSDTDPAYLTDYLEVFRASCIADRTEWMVCAFGPPETRALAATLALGGKARVGFENNFHHANGTIAADNAARVRDISQIASLLSAS